MKTNCKMRNQTNHRTKTNHNVDPTLQLQNVKTSQMDNCLNRKL